MTNADHENLMNQQAEKYLTSLSEKDQIIQDLRYQISQYKLATAGLGWLLKKAAENPVVEP